MKELRPVEELYLLRLAGEELADANLLLAAILGYLHYGGYLEYDQILRLSRSGESALKSKLVAASGILRPYEHRVLKAVRDDDYLDLTATVFSGDLYRSLIEAGLCRIEITRGRIFDKRTVVRTEEFVTMVELLKLKRASINAEIIGGRDPDARLLVQVYAFPSLMTPEFQVSIDRTVITEAGASELATMVAMPAIAFAVSRTAELQRQVMLWNQRETMFGF